MQSVIAILLVLVLLFIVFSLLHIGKQFSIVTKNQQGIINNQHAIWLVLLGANPNFRMGQGHANASKATATTTRPFPVPDRTSN